MVPIERRILTKSDCYQAGRTIVPQGIMIHSTGVAQPDPEAFCRQWDRPGVDACVHAFVAEDRIVQTLPWNWRGWHAGRGTLGSANNTHISFECCEPAGHTYQGGTMIGYDPGKNQGYFEKIYENAVDLCAMLCRDYGLDPLEPGVVLCHAEGYQAGIASDHADVLHWWPRHGVTMDDFRRAVWARLEADEEDRMTQEQFNTMLEKALRQRSQEAPAAWSQAADSEAVWSRSSSQRAPAVRAVSRAASSAASAWGRRRSRALCRARASVWARVSVWTRFSSAASCRRASAWEG